jgi:cell shape-determining protein MreD
MQLAAAVLMCTLASFVNYCIVQIVTPYFLPLTMIPVFTILIYDFDLPIMLIVLLGLLDDVMLNCPIGLSVLMYSSLAYLVYAHMKRIANKKLVVIAFVILFFLINVISAWLSFA